MNGELISLRKEKSIVISPVRDLNNEARALGENENTTKRLKTIGAKNRYSTTTWRGERAWRHLSTPFWQF